MKILNCLYLLAATLGAVSVAEGRSVACTEADKKYMFTPCNTATGTMQSVQYYDAQCNPSTSAALDAPKTTPCYVDCRDGQFYSPKTVGCDLCVPGTSSRSDSITFYDFRELPDYAMSYCFPQPCKAWTAENDGNIFTSGNQTGLAKKNVWGGDDETVESSFVIFADIVDRRGGAVKFSYRVESEKMFDGLAIFIDGQVQANPDRVATGTSRFWASGVLYQWRTSVLEIPFGRHQIKFAFTKDSNQMSSSGQEGVGNDRAYLREVTLIGVQSFAPQCEPCGPGTYAGSSGAPKCLTCPANTYAKAGAAECTHCDSDEWSPEGSGSCRKKLPCTKEDYVAMYGTCDASTQTRHRLWRLINTRCIVDSSVAPQDGAVECATCMPGTLYDSKSGKCQRCPLGMALTTAGGLQCQRCPPKTAATPIWDYSDGFDQFGGDFPESFATQECTDVCTNCANTNHPNGNCWFELASYPLRDSDGTIVGIRQSQYMGNYYTATMTIPFEVITDGTVEVSYAYIHSTADPTIGDASSYTVPDSLTGSISIDGTDYAFDRSYVSTTQRLGKILVNVPTGSHTMKFTVSQAGVIDLDDRFDVVLLGIKIVGEPRGGNPSCEMCTAGHYCPGGTAAFIPCEPGTYTYGVGSQKCERCSAGFAQPASGAKYCNYCSAGTVPNADKTLCDNTCNITGWAGSWDLTPLRGMVFGPIAAVAPVSATNGALPMSQSAVPFSRLPETAVYDAANVARFYISPCSYVNSKKSTDRTCTTRSVGAGSSAATENVADSFACQRVSGEVSYSLGADVSYSYGKNKLVQYVTSGDACAHGAGTRKTNITYVCDPNDSPGTLTFVNEAPQCQYNFVLNSRYGCPICTRDSFERIEVECSAESNVKKTSYFKKSAHAGCFGGYEPPADVSEPCRMCRVSDFSVVWSDCVDGKQKATHEIIAASAGCTDTPAFQKQRVADAEALGVRACSKIDAKLGNNAFTVGLVFVIVGIGLACAAAYIFYKRHADLTMKYHRLATSNGGSLEMAEHEDYGHDDDDDEDDDRFEAGNIPAPGAIAATAASNTAMSVTAATTASTAGGNIQQRNQEDV